LRMQHPAPKLFPLSPRNIPPELFNNSKEMGGSRAALFLWGGEP
jgi:hypothetical protein